jgi:membrane protease YdiL (CAAX protease family)
VKVAESAALLRKENVGSFTSSDLLLGAAGSTVSLTIGYGAQRYTQDLLENTGINLANSQSYFHIYDWLATVSSGLVRGILKATAVFSIVLLIPIIEEWVFRDLMYSWQEASNANGNRFASRAFRVISNAIVFGAFHFSPLLGWSNIPIIVVSTIAGFVFSLLRELTGDRWASVVAHSMNNSFVLFINFLRI